MKILRNVLYAQAKNSYCIQIGSWAFLFGKKEGWRLELFTYFHRYRFTRSKL